MARVQLVDSYFSKASVKDIFKFGAITNYSGLRVQDSDEFIDEIQKTVRKMLKPLVEKSVAVLDYRQARKLRIDDIKQVIEANSCAYPFLQMSKGAYFDVKLVMDKKSRAGSKVGIGMVPTRRAIQEFAFPVTSENPMIPEETVLAFQTIIESYIFYLGQVSAEFAVACGMNTVKSAQFKHAIKVLAGPSKLVNSNKDKKSPKKSPKRKAPKKRV